MRLLWLRGTQFQGINPPWGIFYMLTYCSPIKNVFFFSPSAVNLETFAVVLHWNDWNFLWCLMPVKLQHCSNLLFYKRVLFVIIKGMPFAPTESLGGKMQTKRSSWTPLNHHLSNSHVCSSDLFSNHFSAIARVFRSSVPVNLWSILQVFEERKSLVGKWVS